MLTYEEPAYAADRLMGTIVRHKDRAVKVGVIGGPEAVEISYIVTGKRDLCNLKDLDITPVPLGFCNYNGSITYLSRSPVRQDWKQGLRSKTLRSSSPNWHVDEIPFKAIGKTIEGDFPSFDDSIKNLKTHAVDSMAWCRDFALDTDFNIFYKTLGIVGKFLDVREYRFQLDKQYQWVRESLEEVVHA